MDGFGVGSLSTEDVDNVVDSELFKREIATFFADFRWLG